MSNRILFDEKEITPHRVDWVIQDCQESLIKGKIDIQRNSNEDLEYWQS